MSSRALSVRLIRLFWSPSMPSRKARTLALLLPIILILLCARAGAQKSSLDALLDSLAGSHGIRQVAISPDGQRVAWVEANGAPEHGIFVCTLAEPASTRHRITAGDDDQASEEREIAWSPDSRQLAFLSNAEAPD